MSRSSLWSPLAALLLFGASCQNLSTPLHYDIGAIERPVCTSSPEAQLWFNRGLAMCFGFNHEEAIQCFERAAKADPACAMLYWGKAYALGPNYNAAEITEDAAAAAFAAIRKAQELRATCSEVERDLIDALAVRFPSPRAEARPPIEARYAAAMRRVHAAHPDDADVAALTGEALMQLRPWKLWAPDGEAAPEIAEIRSVLEPALARWPSHPALCHLYIHAMEAGPEVDKATPAAERLETLAPGLGHLVHMPSHIYVWTGRYADGVRINLRAIESDKAYVAHAGRENMFTLYRVHNYHFAAYCAMFEGRQKLALEAARELVREIPQQLVETAADFTDIFFATPYHVMLRFGMWEEMLREAKPAAALLATRAVWHYARGVALAALGRVDAAVTEQRLFREAKAAVPETRVLFNNSVADILGVGAAVLAGEIEYRRGRPDAAFRLLREAVALDEALSYDEPWGWMEPARHALGALLTEQKRYAEAVAVYRKNLARFPNNGWALHGLAECLEGLGRREEASEMRRRFKRAWQRADTQIPGSCFCKTK